MLHNSANIATAQINASLSLLSPATQLSLAAGATDRFGQGPPIGYCETETVNFDESRTRTELSRLLTLTS